MITVGWCGQLGAEEAAELDALLQACADYDAEAGFSQIRAHDPVGPNSVRYQALARLQPGHGTVGSPLVACLRLDVDRAGGADAQLVVHPDHRSLGIATLLSELLAAGDAGTGQGWAGTGAFSISCWSHADHPAAARMADRLGAQAASETQRLVRAGEVRYVAASDAGAVTQARAAGFVHEHSDVRYVLRVG